jgi:plastocyanin
MGIPKILLIVPLLVAGMYLPAAGPTPASAPIGVLGMTHEHFTQDKVTVKCGERLSMVNTSRWVHIIGPGRDGVLTPASTAVPVTRRVLLQTSDSYTTGRWTTPGEYHLTCAVHPEMTVDVVVTGCCCQRGSAGST